MLELEHTITKDKIQGKARKMWWKLILIIHIIEEEHVYKETQLDTLHNNFLSLS